MYRAGFIGITTYLSKQEYRYIVERKFSKLRNDREICIYHNGSFNHVYNNHSQLLLITDIFCE